jgi:hypothetical protein
MRSGGHFDGGHDGGVDILRGGWAGGCKLMTGSIVRWQAGESNTASNASQ